MTVLRLSSSSNQAVELFGSLWLWHCVQCAAFLETLKQDGAGTSTGLRLDVEMVRYHAFRTGHRGNRSVNVHVDLPELFLHVLFTANVPLMPVFEDVNHGKSRCFY